jgi:hypothetical protein
MIWSEYCLRLHDQPQGGNRRKVKMRGALKGLLLAVLVLAPLPALADSFQLTLDHCTGGCGSSPFGTIEITQGANANTVHFVITLDFASFVQTGQAGSTLAFNIIGNPSITLANVSLPGWSLDSSTAGSLQADGFGNFEYSINCCFGQNGGANAQAGPVSFDIVSTGALTPQSFQELSSGGSPSVFFALDILSATTGNTGFVGAPGPPITAVPEPATLLLVGSGLSALALKSRKRKTSK